MQGHSVEISWLKFKIFSNLFGPILGRLKSSKILRMPRFQQLTRFSCDQMETTILNYWHSLNNITYKLIIQNDHRRWVKLLSIDIFKTYTDWSFTASHARLIDI